MCEWTPPWETSPSRCTSPPRARARSNAPTSASFSKNEPSRIARVHALQVLEEDPAGADRQVADLGVPHLPLRQPDGLAGGLQRRVRVLAPEPVEDRRAGELDRVAGPGRRAAPAVEDDERYEVEAARQIAAKESGSSEAPPTRAPSIDGWASSSAAFSGLTEPP